MTENFSPYDRVFVYDDQTGQIIKRDLTYGWAQHHIAKNKARHGGARYQVIGPFIEDLAPGIYSKGYIAARQAIEDYQNGGTQEDEQPVNGYEFTEEEREFLVDPEPQEVDRPEAGQFHEAMHNVGHAVAELENAVILDQVDDVRAAQIAEAHGIKPGRRKGKKLAQFIVDNLKKQ
jgi:hypothetical protein